MLKLELEDVKAELGLKNDDKDEQIEALIPSVENFIKGYCNIKEIPKDYRINAIKMIDYTLTHRPGVSAESLSRHSIQYLDSLPPILLKGLRRRLRW